MQNTMLSETEIVNDRSAVMTKVRNVSGTTKMIGTNCTNQLRKY